MAMGWGAVWRGSGKGEKKKRTARDGDGVGFVSSRQSKDRRSMVGGGGPGRSNRSKALSSSQAQAMSGHQAKSQEVTQVSRNQFASGHRQEVQALRPWGSSIQKGSSHVSHRLPGCLLAVERRVGGECDERVR